MPRFLKKRVVLGSDHAGWALKEKLRTWLEQAGWLVCDLGCAGPERCDYPDFAAVVAQKVASGSCRAGILICGTGTGMSIAANKHPGIRAAACTHEFLAVMARRHNNANILCLGARIVGDELALAIAQAFLRTEFEGGRHAGRVKKIRSAERR